MAIDLASYRIVSMRFEKSQVTEMTVLKSPHQTIDNILPSRDWKRPQFTDFMDDALFSEAATLEPIFELTAFAISKVLC